MCVRKGAQNGQAYSGKLASLSKAMPVHTWLKLLLIVNSSIYSSRPACSEKGVERRGVDHDPLLEQSSSVDENTLQSKLLYQTCHTRHSHCLNVS